MMYPAAPIHEKALLRTPPVRPAMSDARICCDDLHIDITTLSITIGVKADTACDDAGKNVDRHRKEVSRSSSKAWADRRAG